MIDYSGCIGYYPKNDKDPSCDHLSDNNLCSFFKDHECDGGHLTSKTERAIVVAVGKLKAPTSMGREFVEWMENRLEENIVSISSYSASLMAAVVSKYSYNLENPESPIPYTEEEKVNLSAAEVVYLLGM